MKLTKSKQFLADAIHTSGKGWSDGANWAVQNGDHGRISFSENKPVRHGKTSWMAEGGFKSKIEVCDPQKNWHQTVLSREEYFSVYPAETAADADGWIEWNGGGCPVEKGTLVDVKYANGVTNFGVSALTSKSDDNHKQGTCVSFLAIDWGDGLPMSGIVAYRLHRPAVDAEFCESVTRSIPEPEAKPTIEQLASDYRNKLDCANRKQQEADDAKAVADAALGELERAGDELGLVIVIVTPEPVTAKFTGKFHSAKYGDRPSSLEMICDGCGKRFGSHVGFDCRP